MKTMILWEWMKRISVMMKTMILTRMMMLLLKKIRRSQLIKKRLVLTANSKNANSNEVFYINFKF
jgi:hypothetical protein